MRLTRPFLALGIAFVAIGIVLGDRRQLYFGFVWLLIAAIAFGVRAARKNA